MQHDRTTTPRKQRTMKSKTLLAAAIVGLPAAVWAEGASPWLPIPGQLTLGVSHTEQSGDAAYIGSTELPLTAITGGAASKYKRATTQLRIGYGLSDSLALDGTIGYGKVRVGAADRSSGNADSVLGLSWRVLDEYERAGVPTVTLRGAAILKGDYDGARLAAIGNDENGLDLSLLVGKEVVPGLALWAELGVQDRSGGVPNARYVEVGARWRFAPGWNASVGYSDKQYGGDLDIGGPGFTPARFQEVRAERSVAKLGVGYGLAGNQGVALSLAKAVNGRNTVKDDQIVGLAYTIGF
jgi:hypothetical protein